MATRSWSDLTSRQRMATVAFGTVQLALTAAALRDIRRRAPSELRGSRRAWRVAAFANWVGPLAYFAFGRRRLSA